MARKEYLHVTMEPAQYDELVRLARACGYEYGDKPNISQALRLALTVAFDILDCTSVEQQAEADDDDNEA